MASSGPSLTLTQKWLSQNVAPYVAADRVYADVDDTLSRWSSLRPKADVYTYDDGRSQLLLCIHGLVPITFRGASYNIPVAVWIPRDYPREPPIAYVVPTSDMVVKPGPFLDASGRCAIQYLQNWQRKSEGCNLSALLVALQDHFAKEPPVYAKPKQAPHDATRAVPTPDPTHLDRSQPPLPPSTPSRSVSLSQPFVMDDRPRLPPKPMSPFVSPVTSPSPRGPVSPHAHPQQTLLIARDSGPSLPPLAHQELSPPRYRSPPVPPVPPHHLFSGANSPAYRPLPSSQYDPALPASPSSGPSHRANLPASQPPVYYTSPTPTVLPPVPPLPPQAVGPVFTLPVDNPATHLSSPHPPQVPRHPPPVIVPQPPQLPARFSPPNLLDEDSTESESQTISLSHSPSAPPRPPNPELLSLHTRVRDALNSEFASVSQALAVDAERLRAHQTDLLAGEPAVRDEMARLEAVRDVCRNVATRMRSVVDQAERNVAELRRKGDPAVDELVCSTTIVHNQLINLVAEDNAIEDTIYHLHRALNTGRIDLERFLRTARVLAEEQFMKRALIEKIEAGLPAGMSIP